MESGIYKWISPSGKMYIGQAVNLKSRKNEFLNFNRKYTSQRNSNKLSAIDKARNKYNKAEDWIYEILEYASIEDLNDLEIKYISIFNTTNSKIGYNSTTGGDGSKGVLWGTEKQIEALKNRRSYVGTNNPNYGKHLSDEAKENLRNKHLGLKQTSETIAKKSKKVIQCALDGQEIKTFDSITTASKEMNCDKSLIMRVCQGKKKTAKGYIWKYFNK